MKKKAILLTFCSLVSALTSFAQGYLSDASITNAVLTRDPARQASTEVDAVVTNPAGMMLLENGFHISANGIFSYQKINSKLMNGSASTLHSQDIRVLPAIQLAFKKEKWAISASFNAGGGYGKRQLTDGSIIADEVIGFTSGGMLDELNTEFRKGNEMSQLIAVLGGLPSPDIKSEDKFSFLTDESNMSLYNWTMQLGGAFKITKNLSAYVGVKANHVMTNLDTKLGLMVTRPSTGQQWGIDDYMQKHTQIVDNLAGLDESVKEKYKEVVGTVVNSVEAIRSTVEDSRGGWGIAPVIGLDYKIKNVNLGAKYEFASRINVKHSDLHFNVPSTLSLGANWMLNKHLRLAAGSNIIFDTKHNLHNYNRYVGSGLFESNSDIRPCAFDLSASCTYYINEKFLVSGGYTYSHEQKSAPEIAAYVLKAGPYNRLSFGAAYSPLKNMQINLGISTYVHRVKYDAHTTFQAGTDNLHRDVNCKYVYGPRVQVALGINYRI